jgi:hypothetical protein
MRLAFVAVFLFGSLAYCQDQNKDDKDKKEPARKPVGMIPDNLIERADAVGKEGIDKLLETTKQMATCVEIFGGLLIALVALLAWHKIIGETSAVRVMALFFLATLAVYLIVGGYSQIQISPVMTLLGTLAGYIFGRSTDHPQSPPAPPPNTTASS